MSSVSDHHPPAKGGRPIAGGRPPPAAGSPIAGSRACASACGDTLPLHEESEDAGPLIVDAVLVPPPLLEGGGSPATSGLAPAADPHGPAGAGAGGRACTDASGSALRLREEDAEATTPALTEQAAVITDGAPPADGGFPEATALTPAADSPKRAGAGAGAAGTGAAAAAADRPMPTAAPPAPSGNGDRDAGPIAFAAPPVLPQRDLPTPRQGVASSVATDQLPAATHLLAAQRTRGASQPPLPADPQAEDAGAVAADTGGRDTSPLPLRVPGRRSAAIPDKQSLHQHAYQPPPLPSASLHRPPPGPHQPIADAMAPHHQESNRDADEGRRVARAAANAARAAQDLLHPTPVTGITPLPSTTSLHQPPQGTHQPIADEMASHHQESNRNANEVWRMPREAADAARAAQDLLQAPVTGITPLPPDRETLIEVRSWHFG